MAETQRKFKLNIDESLQKKLPKELEANTNLEATNINRSMCSDFYDWYDHFVIGPNKNSLNYYGDGSRNISHNFSSEKSALDYLATQFRLKKESLQKRAHNLRDCILEKTENQSSFHYIVETDNFSHNVTVSNVRYVNALSEVLANIDFVIDTIVNHSKETLLVVTTDHGGDETIFQQERWNHQTPNNNRDNVPFLLLASHNFSDNFVNQNITLNQTEVSGIIGFFAKGASPPVFSDFNQDYFKNLELNLKYLRIFERKGQFLVKSFYRKIIFFDFSI